MDNQGWIKLHRKLLDNPISKNHKYAWLWCVLLLLANHQDNEFLHGNVLVKIKRGQFLTGRDELSKQSGIKAGTIETILNYLESQQQIKQQKTSRYRIITILNYDEYQENQQPSQQQIDNRLTTKRQQNDTNKNDKNVNNEKKEIGKKLPNPQILELKEYLEEKIGTLDGNVKENGQYCWNLIRKMKKDYPDHDPVKSIKLLIDRGLQDEFHAKNLTSFKYLYYHTKQIIGAVLQKKSNYIAV